MTAEQKQKIDSMSHFELAELWRFGRSENPLFQGECGKYFRDRFFSMGGMNPTLSKELGWDR